MTAIAESPAFRVTIAAAVAALVGTAMAHLDTLQRPLLLTALALLAPLPIVVRAVQRRFDPFEPIFLLSVGVTVLFVVRPLAQLAYDQPLWRGYDIRPGYDGALGIALVGILGLYAGYAISVGARIADRIPGPPPRWRPDLAWKYSAGVLLLGLLLTALFVRSAGGLGAATGLLAGRSTGENALFDNTTAYFYFGPYLAIPAALILLETGSRPGLRGIRIFGICSALAVTAITVPRGDRLWLTTLGLALAVLPYLRRQARPRTVSLVIVAAVVFFLGVTFLRDSRDANGRQQSRAQVLAQAFTNPGASVQAFVLGSDTEMFPVLAILRQETPSSVPYRHGVTLSSLVLSPLPRQLFPSKPESADIQINSFLFPAIAEVTKAGESPSMLGGFYYDWGLLGVFVGSLLVGIAARAVFRYFIADPASGGRRILFAAALPLTIIMLRSNPTDMLARMAFVLLPIVLFLWVSARAQRREESA